MKQTAHILEIGCNGAVVQLPERKFPGLVIQGDTLSILMSDFEELKENIGKNDTSEIQASIDTIESHLRDRLTFYESTLAKHGIHLPYSRK
jgi:hypothetical protein